MSVAAGLLESSFPRQGARIMMFIGGPATVGPGQIVGRAKSESIRSHTDLQKNNAPFHKNDYLIEQGAPGREFFVLIEGKCEAVREEGCHGGGRKSGAP